MTAFYVDEWHLVLWAAIAVTVAATLTRRAYTRRTRTGQRQAPR